MADKVKKKKDPISSFSILLILLVVLAVASWIAAAATGGVVTGASLSNILTAPIYGFAGAPEGIVESSANPDTFPGGALEVCFFVMILGGFLGVMTKTGALDNGIGVLVKKLHGNELVLIPILMILFSIGGTTYGMCEETVPFYVLLAATMYAAGFDVMVGSAVVLLGAGCGVIGSTVNPFAVGAAVSSLIDAGIEVNQGIITALGAILWIATTAISIIYVMKYAAKVKKDRGSTILSLQEQADEKAHFGKDGDAQDEITLTGRQKGALVVFAIAFIIMVISFIPWEDFGINVFTGWSAVVTGLPLGQWYFLEAACWFFVLAIIIAVIGGLSESETVKAFIDGCADMMSVVMIIALARGVSILMAETGMSDWILLNASNALQGVSAIVFAPVSWLLYVVLSFLIPSSSGMATVSMPIMGPLAANLGFSVETMVMIFSSANGLVNLFTPTCGAIMGGLAIAKVQYGTWLKWVWKLLVILAVVCLVVVTTAMMIL